MVNSTPCWVGLGEVCRIAPQTPTRIGGVFPSPKGWQSRVPAGASEQASDDGECDTFFGFGGVSPVCKARRKAFPFPSGLVYPVGTDSQKAYMHCRLSSLSQLPPPRSDRQPIASSGVRQDSHIESPRALSFIPRMVAPPAALFNGSNDVTPQR